VALIPLVKRCVKFPRNGIVYLSLESRCVEIGEARACFGCDSRVYLHVRRHHVSCLYCGNAATESLFLAPPLESPSFLFHGRATTSLFLIGRFCLRSLSNQYIREQHVCVSPSGNGERTSFTFPVCLGGVIGGTFSTCRELRGGDTVIREAMVHVATITSSISSHVASGSEDFVFIRLHQRRPLITPHFHVLMPI
jgi:hypothetical protein